MTEPAQATAEAVRLIFEYEDDQVRLILQQPVDLQVSGFDTSAEIRQGHFVETRNAQGVRLARVPVRGGFVQSAEVFPENHADPITRVDTEARGAFTVVVPASDAAASVAIVRVAPDRPEAGIAPGGGATSPPPGATEDVDIATFPLQR